MLKMPDTELLSLSDIARLANVQRPVVSVWRSRSKSSAAPFPESVARNGTQEFFAATEVVAWLETTGRGNNAHVAEDMTAHTLGARADFISVSALLALYAMSGERLSDLDYEDLLDLADETDPEDAFIYSEIEALDQASLPLVKYTERLIDAAFGVVPAFEQLMADRFRLNNRELAECALSASALQIAATAALEISSKSLCFTENTLGGSDLLITVAKLLGESTLGTFLVPENSTADTVISRLVLRRLRIHCATQENIALIRPDGSQRGVVHLAQYPGPGDPQMSFAAVLDSIEELVLQLQQDERAIILAPASLLINQLDSPDLEGARSAILRSGRVRAAVRLPRGLVVSKPQQALGFWVLGPEPTSVPLGERGILTADLLDQTIDDSVMGDLATDIAASLGGSESIRRHAFRFAQLMKTSTILASKSGLIPEAKTTFQLPAGTYSNSAEALVRTEAALDETNSTAGYRPELDIPLQARAAEHQAGPQTVLRTVAELQQSGAIRHLPGTRISEDDLAPKTSSGVKVWQAEDLAGGTATRIIPVLALAAKYPRAKLTEPGDIVFRSGPHPVARVDAEGAAVVRFPAQILRVDQQPVHGIVPLVLASDINSRASGHWKRWSVRSVPSDQVSSLTAALLKVNSEKHAAEERLKRLEEFSTRLVSGVTNGELEMMKTNTSTEGRP
ncbi:hypothetical protein ACTXJR_15025 [Glutamicibacter ardleyensis]|uniref:hypothetical protein n=1 Tax=Glutamicibacter ardleyensis TaxID=225894 RepID=UPI003FD20040